MNKQLEALVQKMIDDGYSEEEIGLFIQISTKQIISEPNLDNYNSNDSNQNKSEVEPNEESGSFQNSKLIKLLPFAFDIALVVLFGTFIYFFISAKDLDYDSDEVLFSFCTLFSMIILAKWFWNFKEEHTGIKVKNYIFYLLLFSALLFGMFYISLFPE